MPSPSMSDPAVQAVPPDLCGPRRFVHDRAPINVYWETTLACDLACQHCRASARPEPAPGELTTDQARAFMEDVKDMGSTLILTGGDPLKRPDLADLLAHARSIRLPVGITPAATPRLTAELIDGLKSSGVAMMGLSLDGWDARSQDGFRGVAGTFDRTLRALQRAADVDLPVQINTTVTGNTATDLPLIADRLMAFAGRPVRRWSLFFLIPTGRGAALAMPRRSEVAALFGWVRDQGTRAGFQITTVEAPQYRRYCLEREHDAGSSWSGLVRGTGARGLGIRDGNGIIFVSHLGEVYPSGFLPTPLLGRVQERPLSGIYRDHEILKRLRDPDGFRGTCGRCSFRWVCGGSRARAFAMTGDLLGPDPLCPF